MSANSNLRAARSWLVIVIALGCCLAFFNPLWLEVEAATSVDQVLTPAELQDPKLIDIVYRTHRKIDGRFVLPHRVFGAATVVCAIFGLLSLRDAERDEA
jgi:hypothetical protein